jgi:hypothetical protein
MNDVYESERATGEDGARSPAADPCFAEWPEGDLQQELRRRELQVRDFVKAHPVPVLLGALVAGALLARLLRKD